MRDAFGILEALLSLMIFSVVILVCSKTLLEVNKDLRLFKATQAQNIDLTNAMLYLRKALHYGIIKSFSSQEIVFFDLDQEIFLSPNFHPIPKPCPSAKISGRANTQSFAFFDQGMEIIQAIGYQDGFLFLDREIGCNIAIPLKAKHRIWLKDGNLLLDDLFLLGGIKRIHFVEFERFYQIEICREICTQHQILKSRIMNAF